MTDTPIKFDDGEGYERFMGHWSRLAGAVFLDWLAPEAGRRWLDVGCGNGAFTEMIVDHCAPASVVGVDPSEAQLKFARTRPAARLARFEPAGAEALPFGDAAFDAATMALVIFFVPDPAQGLREMVRVVRPGGSVSAYAWDILGGGFPLDAVQSAIRALGLQPPLPPSVAISPMEPLRALWQQGGLLDVQSREIVVQRRFDDFDDYWSTGMLGTSVKAFLRDFPADQVRRLREETLSRLAPDLDGGITITARANAVKGIVAG